MKTYDIDQIEKFLKFTPFNEVDISNESIQKYYRNLIYRKLPIQKFVDSFLDLGKDEEFQSTIAEAIHKSETNKIKGGLGDNLSLQDISKKHGVSLKQIKDQLAIGLKIEMEHTDDHEEAMEIAMDHLTEFANYYTKLEQMESEMEKENKK